MNSQKILKDKLMNQTTIANKLSDNNNHKSNQSIQTSKHSDDHHNNQQQQLQIQQLTSDNQGEHKQLVQNEQPQKIQIQKQQISEDTQQQQKSNEQLSLKHIKSSEELAIDFKENQKILTSLNTNIDDLFKKISQLTDSISTDFKQEYQPIKLNTQVQTNQLNNHNIDNDCHGIQSQQALTLPGKKQVNSQQQNHQFNNQQNTSVIRMSQFQTGKTIGYGKFGQVLQCKHLETGLLYALKKIFKSTIQEYKMQEQLLVQLQAQKRIKHQNIVQIYCAFTDQFHIFMLMEYVNGVQLTKKFKSEEKFVKKVIRQILQAVKVMHEHNIVHRDLKPQNILVTQNDIIKIVDFGWSSIDGKQLNIMCGTLDYLSPEMSSKQQYDYKIDLWSIGILTYELIYGKSPFREQSKQQTIERIKKIDLNFPEDVDISEHCKDFIQGYLQPANTRKDINWGLQHQFLKNNEENQNESFKFENDDPQMQCLVPQI